MSSVKIGVAIVGVLVALESIGCFVGGALSIAKGESVQGVMCFVFSLGFSLITLAIFSIYRAEIRQKP